MEIIRDNIFKLKDTCVTVGKFDGIHKGHKEILKVMRTFRIGLKTVVLTFDINEFCNTLSLDGNEKTAICSFDEKAALLEKLGVDYLIIYPFDRSCADMEPEDFVKGILVDKLDISVFVCGRDFTFGKGARGNCDLLKNMGKELGFETVICDDVMYDGVKISSSRIRQTLSSRNYDEAEKMLR